MEQLQTSLQVDSWSEIRRKLFSDRLEGDVDVNIFDIDFKKCLELEDNFLTLSARQNIDYINLGSFMALVFEEFKKAYDTKVLPENETIVTHEIGRMTKRQLNKRLISFFNKCLRMIRAFNFDSTLVEQCLLYYEYLFVSNYVVDQQIISMRYFFASAF